MRASAGCSPTAGHQVVGCGRPTVRHLLAAVDEHRPDVAVIDIRMPPTFSDEGLRAALTLRQRHPGVGVLVFSQYIETRYAAQLLATTRPAWATC